MFLNVAANKGLYKPGLRSRFDLRVASSSSSSQKAKNFSPRLSGRARESSSLSLFGGKFLARRFIKSIGDGGAVLRWLPNPRVRGSLVRSFFWVGLCARMG